MYARMYVCMYVYYALKYMHVLFVLCIHLFSLLVPIMYKRSCQVLQSLVLARGSVSLGQNCERFDLSRYFGFRV